MAGDWFMMRNDLRDDPDVIAMAARMKTTEVHVVGMLGVFWGWVDRQLAEGNATGVTKLWVDRYVGVVGFAKAMTTVGWLEVSVEGLTIPEFNIYFSQSAKRRALAAKRQAKHKAKRKAKKGNAKRVTKASPQDRTGQETPTESLPITGDALDGVRFRAKELAQSTVEKLLPDRDGLSEPDRKFFWGVSVLACLVLPEEWLADAVESTLAKKPDKPGAWLRTVLEKSAKKMGEDLGARLKEVEAIGK